MRDFIVQLMNRPRVKQSAVANFLGSLEGLSRDEAIANMELDAHAYGWNEATRAAIIDGIEAICTPRVEDK